MLDWLFAPRCIACGNSTDEPMCEPCSETLEALEAIDRRPQRSRPLERIVSAWQFGGQLAIAIRRLKLAGHTYVARSVAPLWAPLIAAAAEPDALVVPVPLHWRRRFARGFDHAWLLARHACAAENLPPPVPALRRTRHAPPQSTLSRAERLTNLHGAFAVRRPVAGRSIVLVDDVTTTGATLAECARVLLAAGATRVVGVVLATSAPG